MYMNVDMSFEEASTSKILPQDEPIKRELPELVVVPDSLGLSEKLQIVTEVNEPNDMQFGATINTENIYTGSTLSKSIYPEKDAWAHKIIKLMIDGKNNAARTELERFKKVYPDYPIEEQIKGLTR